MTKTCPLCGIMIDLDHERIYCDGSADCPVMAQQDDRDLRAIALDPDAAIETRGRALSPEYPWKAV